MASNDLISFDTEDLPSSPINTMDNTPSMQTTYIRNGGIENNIVNGTITIVREKCKTLILKLSTPSRAYFGWGNPIKPDEDIDQIIDELGTDLTRGVVEGINGIRDEVKSARPSSNDPNYNLKLKAYKDLLEYTTQLINELTQIFDETLTDYRNRVEQLWNDIHNTNDWERINNYIQQFQNGSEALFADAVHKFIDPYINVIESKLSIMKQ